MHAVIRSYSGSGAKALFIRSISGFVSYSLIRTDDGGITVTVCNDKAGTDESIQAARDWIQTNASDLGIDPPSISEGQVALHLS